MTLNTATNYYNTSLQVKKKYYNTRKSIAGGDSKMSGE